jgi:lipoate-protein ligase A
MGCGCNANKNNRSAINRPQVNGPIRNLNIPSEKITDTVPNITANTVNRIENQQQIKQDVQQKYLNPERLRIERLRREAIQKALGKN